MNTKQETRRSSSAVRQVAAAVVAMIAGAISFIAICLLLEHVFPTHKGILIPGCFLAAAIGLLVGGLFYKTAAPVGLRISELSPVAQRANLIGNAVFGAQLFTYFSLCFAMAADIHIPSRQLRSLFWPGLYVCIAGSTLSSLAAAFWVYPDTGNRITHVLWRLVLFAIMHAAFLGAATWLADPFTIPNKLLR